MSQTITRVTVESLIDDIRSLAELRWVNANAIDWTLLPGAAFDVLGLHVIDVDVTPVEYPARLREFTPYANSAEHVRQIHLKLDQLLGLGYEFTPISPDTDRIYL